MTAIVRDAAHANSNVPNLEFKPDDVLKAERIVVASKGSDVVTGAYRPGPGDAAQSNGRPAGDPYECREILGRSSWPS
jgi:hypothetical protein